MLKNIVAAIAAFIILSAIATGSFSAATLIVTVLAFAAFAWAMR